MQLLKVRLYQVKSEWGLLIFLFIAIAFSLSYFFFTREKHISLGFAVILLLSVYKLQVSRKDLPFVLKYFNKPYLQLFTEYSLILFPFSVASLFTPFWYCFFVLHAAVVALVFLKGGRATRAYFLFLPRYIPANQFEWISGIRNNAAVLIIIFLLATLLSPVIFFGLAALLLLNITFLTFYTQCEPVSVLLANTNSAKDILNGKIIYSIKMITVVNMPLLITNSAFHPDFVFANCIFLVYQFCLVALTISAKYNSYRPGQSVKSGSAYMAIASFALFNPYFAVITVILLVKTYSGAIKNLNYYLS